MTALDRYFASATATLTEVATTQGEALEAAARLAADSVAGGGMLHLFGAGHSQLVALDAFLRAGGLACVNPIVDPALAPAAGPDVSRVERTPGHAAAVLEGEDLRPGEVVVVVSNSGVNQVPVEVALGCRDRGLRVVALTNVEQAKAAAAVVAALAGRVAELLRERGATPPVVVSQNLDGRDATERNQTLLRAYRGRTRLPL